MRQQPICRDWLALATLGRQSITEINRFLSSQFPQRVYQQISWLDARSTAVGPKWRPLCFGPDRPEGRHPAEVVVPRFVGMDCF